jgi:hypothetical protein
MSFTRKNVSIVGLASIALLTASAGAQSIPTIERGLLPGDLGVFPAVNSQQDHAIARGGDQYLVVWSDYRARSNDSQTIQSDGDIFGIRLNAAGQPIDPAPFMIAGGMGLQRTPLVAWNGQAWLVVYTSQDPTSGYFEDRMRGVRVSAQGAILDSTPILFTPPQYAAGTIGFGLSGQNGQWLMTRCIYHEATGYGTYLSGQRIDSSGALLDPTPVMLMDWVYGSAAVLVGPGEYLVAGPDWTNSSTIKAQRVSTAGTPIGAQFTLPSLNVASSGSEYYVTWIADFVNLVGSRVTSTGTLLTPSGTLIVPNFSQYNQSSIAHDGSQWWFLWGGGSQLHTVRINASGSVLDPGGGPLLPITIGGTVDQAYGPKMVSRPGGGIHVSWWDGRPALGSDTNVFLLPVTTANAPEAERCVSTGTRNQRFPDLSSGPNSTSAVAFVSEAAGEERVLVHFLDAAGNATTTEPIVVHTGANLGKTGIAYNGSHYMITWDEGPSGLTTTMVKARRMNADGSFIDGAPIDVLSGFMPDIGALGDDFLIVGARYGITGQVINLFGRRFDGTTGTFNDASPITLATGYVSGQARVRSDGTQWLVTTHAQWSHDSSQGDALLIKLPATGAPTFAGNPTPISGGSGDLDVAFSGTEYLLVWRNNSLSNANNYVAGRIMNLNGTFGPSFTIAEAPGRQLRPTAVWDGTTYLVAFDDQRNQQAFFDDRTDIYGARVSTSGTVLDTTAFPIIAGAQGDCSASLLAVNGRTLVASTRFVVSPGSGFDSHRVGVTLLGDVACPADFGQDGTLSVQDIFDYLTAWSAGSASADFNGTDGVSVQDIFDFLSAWSAGCL